MLFRGVAGVQTRFSNCAGVVSLRMARDGLRASQQDTRIFREPEGSRL